jgi:hypothetical protein
MTEEPDFDIQTAHKHFAASCFNLAWELMEKPKRSAAEDEQMIRLNYASLWHWTQRADCSQRNLSVGYWQASRIYALLGQTENARRYARLCLDTSLEEGPFYLGYAYEALARAESVIGNQAEMEAYLAEARRLAEAISDVEEKQMLSADLDTIKS